MQYEHTFPISWDVNWILSKSQVINTYHISRGPTETTLRYTGTTDQWEAIEEVINNYPQQYLNEVAKISKWNEVKALRDEKIDEGAPTPYGAVDSNKAARGNITGAALYATIAKSSNTPFSINWTRLDNSVVTLNADMMIEVASAVMYHVNYCHDRAREIRALINSATTLEELQNIDITTGWTP